MPTIVVQAFLSFPPGGGRDAVKLAPLRRRSRGERSGGSPSSIVGRGKNFYPGPYSQGIEHVESEHHGEHVCQERYPGA
jgi:hypothetical protein